MEKSTSEKLDRKSDREEREKTKIKIEIDLIYYSKLKYNIIGRKTRMKTLSLTQ